MANRRKAGANYKKYAEETLTEAINVIKNGSMSLRNASKHYKIPLGTLHNKLKQKHTYNVGHPRVFTDEEEMCFVNHIITVSVWKFPFEHKDIRVLIKNYLSKTGRTVQEFVENYPSAKWVQRFIRRHSKHLVSRLSQNIKRARAAVTAPIVQDFFKHLEETLKDADGNPIPPTHIFNYDETNLSDDPGNKKCVFKKGVKYPERVRDFSKTCVSIMFAGSAAGNMIPAYVVYKADNLWANWLEGGPANTRYNRSKSGWFDSYTFSDWFETVFLPYVRKLPGTKVLLGDNLSSHFTPTVLKLSAEHNIIFCCFPPNATHLLQPLDVAFYGLLKRAWRDVLNEYKLKGNRKTRTLNKSDFPRLLTKLYNKIYPSEEETSKNLISGFEKCGIYPLNAKKVLDRLPDYKDPDRVTDVAKIQESVSSAVLDLLNVMKRGDTIQQTQRRKKYRCLLEKA